MNNSQAKAFVNSSIKPNNTSDKSYRVLKLLLDNFDKIPFPKELRGVDKHLTEHVNSYISNGALDKKKTEIRRQNIVHVPPNIFETVQTTEKQSFKNTLNAHNASKSTLNANEMELIDLKFKEFETKLSEKVKNILSFNGSLESFKTRIIAHIITEFEFYRKNEKIFKIKPDRKMFITYLLNWIGRGCKQPEFLYSNADPMKDYSEYFKCLPDKGSMYHLRHTWNNWSVFARNVQGYEKIVADDLEVMLGDYCYTLPNEFCNTLKIYTSCRDIEMYSLDVRRQAIKLYSKLQSLRKTSTMLDIHFSSISRWLNNLERKPYPVRQFTKSDLIVETIKDTIQTFPFISERELAKRLTDSFNLKFSKELVRLSIKKLGYTKKKAKYFSCPTSLETITKDFLEKRLTLKNRLFLSIDETSFGRSGFESRGYALKGKKLFIKKKLPRMTTISVCACCSNSKWIGYAKQEGSYNKAFFLEFLKNIDLPSNSVLLLDNIKFHHSKEVVDYLKSIDVIPLFTPPYSPWFNPIEGCFSIVKRSFAHLQDVELAFQSLKPNHFEAFFKKSLEAMTRW
jgi:transposase